MRENYFLDDGTYSASQIIIIMVRRFLEEGPKGKDIYGNLLGGPEGARRVQRIPGSS